MRPAALALLITASFAVAGCTSGGRQTRLYQPGEKATVGHLIYSIVDTQILPRLGDDPLSARVPQNRFYVVQVAVFNSGNTEIPIPAMTLVDDSGQTYNELPDGSGVQRWLGIARNVGPLQTEQGNILFDAPAKHYRIKLTGDTDDSDVFVDVPLSFVHEQMDQIVLPPADTAQPAPGTPPPAGTKK